MIKQKLINRRIEINKTQEEIAYQLGITQSQYSRRESGTIKMTKSEWNSLMKILDTNLETIYEPEDGIYILKNDESANNTGLHYNEYHEFTLSIMKKYIEKLEDENRFLKSKTESL
ncbi:helix-turn-helix transcriptional regulator [Flavobacterium sp. LS1R49]|uniref:Helix-turn-helix transcriptional regulator n=1 Tax=Flavobacterium shii TaxID=2987687 RepID=A0A9X2ZGM9_9FLAO|nr:helix-turn-helix transcriptional regulator [Flavobacterium shii]MCV9930350.1 helix-turn-helix transcriptional regulator [Flavobacterium shii]